MDIKKILLATALSGVLALGMVAVPVNPADAGMAKGKVSKVEREGRVVTLSGGEKFRISGSRTEVMIGGKEGDRADIKTGMDCSADIGEVKGRMEAKWIKCK